MNILKIVLEVIVRFIISAVMLVVMGLIADKIETIIKNRKANKLRKGKFKWKDVEVK